MVEIIAEIANAHQGNPNIAIRLARSAKVSGADAVKFQIYFANDFISKNHSRFDHFEKQSFSINQWRKIIKKTKKLGIKIYCDILGERAFELAKKLNIDGYKIHSSDISNTKLLNRISKQDKKIFLSCGGAKLTEIYCALKILLKEKKKIILLHGFQSYPTKIEDTDLNRLKNLKVEFGDKVEYGFQDHIAGQDKYNLYVCLIALGYGVTYIEKHITFNRKKKGVDYYSSLEPNEFKKFVKIINESKKSIINERNDFSEKEYQYRKQTKKMMMLNKNKKRGQFVYESDIEFKRAETDCKESLNIKYLKGRKLNVNLKKDHILRKIDFINNTIIVVVARTRSKRLTKKALRKIGKDTVIEHLFLRLKKTNTNKKILFCTTSDKSDNVLEKIAKKQGIEVTRGPVKNVLERIIKGLKKYKHNIIIRVTGDDILVDPDYMNIAIEYLLKNNLDYVDHKNLPSGTETEVIDREALKLIYETGNDLEDTEYLTNYITENKMCFKTGSAPVLTKHRSKIRLTIDNKNDLNNVKRFLLKMKKINKLYSYNLNDITSFFSKSNFKKIKLKNKNFKYNTDLNLNRYFKFS